jgi:MFS transporter, SP family, xylose:H+ symportor
LKYGRKQTAPLPDVRTAGRALWIACFVLAFIFPVPNSVLASAGAFRLYAGFCLAGFPFVLLRLPDSRLNI